MLESQKKELTPIETIVYEIIYKRGEMLTKNIPTKMAGAIPKLVDKGLVEIYKRQTSLWSSKKRKFVKLKTENEP